ncbi:CheY-like superfamily [Akanthomyces lecanii RCEF 1005]|uniref:CheY-like superfamily n=1 Tax=Akanthomyces lecanii RCEF 1005 TaxID=1081108 RepID=A0A167T2W7_CORDF|nr:CheY-like superfamily [Akanthomyces lecanii RCEF 1005]
MTVYSGSFGFRQPPNANAGASIKANGVGARSAIVRPGSLNTEESDLALEQLQKIAPIKRILATEDNAVNQTVLKKNLHMLGFKHIAMISNEEEALSELSNSSPTYDMILMDVSMTIMNGHKATFRIRNRGLHIPIISMTAYTLKGDMDKCLEQGMNDYIAKPVNRMVLLWVLPRWHVPSGKLNAVVTVPQNEIVSDGNVRSAVTDQVDIGRFVARIIADPRKQVFAYGDVITQNDAFDLVEKYTGETIPRNHVSKGQAGEIIEKATEAIAANPADQAQMVTTAVTEYKVFATLVSASRRILADVGKPRFDQCQVA